MHRMFSAAVVALAIASPALADEGMPGVSAGEIKIGSTMPFSGPASALSNTGKTEAAYVAMLNEHGGINKRKIKLIALDDGYSPPKAVEQTRLLIEQEQVALMFSPLGTPSNAATIKYVNSRKVPDVLIVSGVTRFADYKEYPYTTTGLVSYQGEAQIYGKYILKEKPSAKIAVLYQNDDLGKDFPIGLKKLLKERYDGMVTTASYEVTDPTVDSQIIALGGSGADVLLVAGTPKFAAQAIRKTFDIGWKPLLIINTISSSIAATIQPAGVEKAVGVVSSAINKDPTDPRWQGDAGVAAYNAFMSKYQPGADPSDVNNVFGYNQAMILVQILKQCGDDLNRENILKQSGDF